MQQKQRRKLSEYFSNFFFEKKLNVDRCESRMELFKKHDLVSNQVFFLI